MNLRKIFRRTLTALLIVACLLIAALVDAAVQIFDGRDESKMDEHYWCIWFDIVD